jgi:hypothetical protein
MPALSVALIRERFDGNCDGKAPAKWYNSLMKSMSLPTVLMIEWE